MTKRIPLTAPKEIADKHKLSQVIIVAWDDIEKVTHVTTYGDSVEACSQAAVGGNMVKKALGWPESLCNEIPVRQQKLMPKPIYHGNVVELLYEMDFTDVSLGNIDVVIDWLAQFNVKVVK